MDIKWQISFILVTAFFSVLLLSVLGFTFGLSNYRSFINFICIILSILAIALYFSYMIWRNDGKSS